MGCLLSIGTVTDIRQQSKCYRNTHTWPEAVCQPINRGHYFSVLFDCLQIKMSWTHGAKKYNACGGTREKGSCCFRALHHLQWGLSLYPFYPLHSLKLWACFAGDAQAWLLAVRKYAVAWWRCFLLSHLPAAFVIVSFLGKRLLGF